MNLATPWRAQRKKSIVKVGIMEKDREVAEEALRRASHKLPIPCKIMMVNPIPNL